jgi:hypothetical protein
MEINYCPSCGGKIHGQIRFCSSCGVDFTTLGIKRKAAKQGDSFKSELKGFIEEFIENNTDLLKELAAKVEKGENVKKGMFFAVEMRGDTPKIRSGNVKDLEKILKETSHHKAFEKLFKEKDIDEVEFTEADFKVIDVLDGRRISINMPGVSSIDDVKIHEIDEGIEVLGRGENRIYFSKVALNSEFEIKSSRMEGENLLITIT